MDKKFCKFCGEEIEKDAMVCPKCGRQLKVVKKEEASSSEKSSETKYDESSKFYTKAWFMWVMLIFFAPVGIFLMWKFHPEMKKNTKIILTIVFAILFLAIAFGGNSDNVKSIVKETLDAVEKKEDETLIKKSLRVLREIAIGAAGNLIASGVVALLGTLPIG